MKNTLLLFSLLIFNNAIAQVSDFKSTDFTIANNVAKLYKGSDLSNLPLLAHNLTYKLPTDVEKFRAIYTWVCNNIKGDIYQNDKVSKQRKKLNNDSLAYIKWNNKYKKTVYKRLINNKKTMCTGYAYLIKELCFFANIECEIVDGYGRSTIANVNSLEMANHSWNAVKLNNKWYLCDATWSSGYIVANALFINDYNDGYFLTDPILFAKNHYPLNKKWLLNNELMQSNFIASPLVYGETFKQKIIPVSPKLMDFKIEKDEEIIFSFKALKKENSNTISLVYFSGNKERTLKLHDLKHENKVTTFKHQFKRKGFFDVHLKIDNNIVATYTIEVTKS
ncbi:transglutaminase domain-containing protein [Lacinutrix algicola]|uniref:transglutaminase domain-containing protein n=1 Tax=Lacinutrix algicola TaxID=342954 RepID=UPI0006E2FF55|nr:transglutaminase domain-containing protein [Lacinutrix algicola]